MWQTTSTVIELNRIFHYKISDINRYLTYQDVIQCWETSEAFCVFFNSILAQNPFTAYFWEVKPIIENDLDRDFEFVIVKNTALEGIKANPSAFQKFLDRKQTAVSFPNLSGDAHLVVPSPVVADEHYAHLARFVRNAPERQIIDFWKLVGRSYKNQINAFPKWLSTSGLGVHWLHVRVDSRPKYYQYQPFK